MTSCSLNFGRQLFIYCCFTCICMLSGLAFVHVCFFTYTLDLLKCLLYILLYLIIYLLYMMLSYYMRYDT